MTPEAVIHIISQAFWTTVLLCAPLLLIGFAVGIIVNIIQIATSLQDSAFSTIPRLAAFLFGFLLLLPWMLKQISAYSISIFADWAVMHGEVAVHASELYGFLLVLARMAGVFIFLPLPGFKAGPDTAKIALALALTFGLYSRWPVIQPVPVSMVQLAGWALAEAAIGLATGLAVSFMIEWLVMAAQAISTQSGFSYASTVDPSTEADVTVLILIAQTVAAMLFFAMGFDRQLLSILARSLETSPPGHFAATRPSIEGLVMLGSTIFSTGIRLVLPLMTLLFLIDLCMGLLGRLNAQLQLMALAFPAKMLVAMSALSLLVFLIPKFYQQSANAAFGALGKFLGL